MTTLESGPRRAEGARPDEATAPDWVALLPGGRLGAVAVLGPVTEDAERALAAGEQVPPGTPVDTVVVTDDRLSWVHTAIRLVRPGGTVRIERSRRRNRLAAVRALRQAGMVDIATWWCRPDVASPRCLVRVDDGGAAATVVRTVADRRRRTGPEATLARTGLAARLAGEVSVMALAPGSPVDLPLAAPGGSGRVDGLVTPGYRRSRAVIGVTTHPTGRRLHGVAKVARRPEHDDHVAHEAAVLATLFDRAGTFPGAPQGAHVARRGERRVLVEAAVTGLPLDRRAVRRDPVGALVAGRRWIEALPGGEVSVPAEDGRAEALLRAPLVSVAARPGIRAATVQAAGGVLGALAREPLPVVFEHGDLGHPNLMVEEGGLAAVDWERACPRGLPLHDLVFLVAYLTESIERTSTPEDLGRSVVRALRPHGWARPELDVHAERLRIDRGLLAGLQVAAWTRYLAARPADAGHREEALWTAAVEDATRSAR